MRLLRDKPLWLKGLKSAFTFLLTCLPFLKIECTDLTQLPEVTIGLNHYYYWSGMVSRKANIYMTNSLFNDTQTCGTTTFQIFIDTYQKRHWNMPYEISRYDPHTAKGANFLKGSKPWWKKRVHLVGRLSVYKFFVTHGALADRFRRDNSCLETAIPALK